MWSHYADCHTGVCLTFDNSKLANDGILACKVKYESSFDAVDFFEQSERSILNMVTTKSSEWSYENEFRSFHEREGKHHYDPSCLIGVTFGCKAKPEDIHLIMSEVRKAGIIDVKWHQARMQANSFDLEIEPFS